MQVSRVWLIVQYRTCAASLLTLANYAARANRSTQAHKLIAERFAISKHTKTDADGSIVLCEACVIDYSGMATKLNDLPVIDLISYSRLWRGKMF